MKSIRKRVIDYLSANPNRVHKAELYREAGNLFNLKRKQVSFYYREAVKEGLIVDETTIPEIKLTTDGNRLVFNENTNGLSATGIVDEQIRTLDELLNACNLNTEEWDVVNWKCGKYDVGVIGKQQFSVKAEFKRKTLDNNLEKQKDFLLEELFNQSKEVVAYQAPSVEEGDKDQLLEIALFDVHFGKLAHAEESGEDYDLKIAEKRFRKAISSILNRVNLNNVGRILLPIGNDMINIDSSAGLTTAGTPQDTDSRFYKIIRTVKDILISTIDMLSTIAPVDIIVCSGNHDQHSSFMMGEIIEAYYHNNNNVFVNNKASLRKYYRFGETSIMFTHGDKEKHTNLGMIFAAENPKLWAATTQRYIQLGHFHSNRKIEYMSNAEYQGFQIQIIPSLSSSDAWHAGKGYMALRQAKGFLYSKTDGLIGEYTHTA